MSSRLLALPAELRVRIYEYTFGDNNPDEIELFKAIENHPETALLATCSEIRNEAQPTHAAAAARYRDHKTFTVMLENKTISASEYKELLASLDELTFPWFVNKLSISYLGSSASLRFTIGENAKLQCLAHKGDAPRMVRRVFEENVRARPFDLDDPFRSSPFVVWRIDNRHRFWTFYVLLLTMSLSMESGLSGDACIDAVKQSQRWLAMSDYIAASRDPELEPQEKSNDQ